MNKKQLSTLCSSAPLRLCAIICAVLVAALLIAAPPALAKYDGSLGWYGVSWNQSTDSYSRRGDLVDFAAAASPGDDYLPVQRLMRRCVMNDSGVVVYYLDPTDSTKKYNGASASLDGTDGQVMVEIPKFYIRTSYSSNVHSWDISLTPRDGFFPHPAFYKDGAWVDYRYMGAYEGSLWDDDTTAMYSDADAVTADTYDDGDKLCSITAQCPKTNETRAEFREAASDRGAGWRNQEYDITTAVQLLYLVEYADFDSQSMIGKGRTMFSSGAWTVAGTGVGDYIGRTGYSNSYGNATATYPAMGSQRSSALDISAIDTSQAAYCDFVSYRGIENFYGNVWQWVDGINVGLAGTHDGGDNEATVMTDSGESWPTNSLIGATITNTTDSSSGTITANTGTTITVASLSGGTDNDWDTGDAFVVSNIVWLCSNEANFADDAYTNYDALYDTSGDRAVLHNADGYAGALEQIYTGFLATDVTGSSTTKVCDYYYQDTGWRVVGFGGAAGSASAAGAFCVSAGSTSSYVNASIGGRLCY